MYRRLVCTYYITLCIEHRLKLVSNNFLQVYSKWSTNEKVRIVMLMMHIHPNFETRVENPFPSYS